MSEADGKHTITFFVNNKPIETTEVELSGAAIKQLAGVPADYQLFEIRGQETVPVGDNQVVKIHPELKFRAIPPGTFGTNGSLTKT
jgi:hypothetical protein